MSGAFTRRAFLALLRLFYPDLGVRGVVPAEGAGCLLVVNHPNGLLDALVVCAAAGRPVGFLAKSTLFSMPVLRGWLAAFDAVPVYRAKEADTSHNDRTFTLVRERLAAGSWVALFPEGISHDGSRLAPLKTGAARIALGCDETVRVVPVGVVYESKETFRSRASATFGAPVDLAPYRAMARDDERAAVRALTDALATALHTVTLEADNADLWNGFVTVATWLQGVGDVGARDAKARELSHGWSRLVERDPTEAHAIADEARAFADTIQRLGVVDARRLDDDRAPGVRGVTSGVASLVFLAPFALTGALLGWIPYRAVRPLAEKFARGELDVVGTYKLLLGIVLLPLWWTLQAIALGLAFGTGVGIVALLFAPMTGYLAPRWDERLATRRALLRERWLAATQSHVADALLARRQALVARIERALAQGSPTA